MTRFENIPDELKQLTQWVCTQNESKVPMRAYAREPASSTNSQTWATFDAACGAVSKGFYDYCGFVFADNGYVGIDIDEGYDQDGFISPLAAEIIRTCQSYTEKSKSGRGFHILLRGTLPFKGKNNLAGVEIYKTARYFIMTGEALVYRNIKENQEAIDYVVKKFFSDTREKTENREFNNRIYSPIWEHPENNRIKLRPIYPRIPDGCRNISLTSLAGGLHNLGYNKKQIYNELLRVNNIACDPPLDKNELQIICNSITRYKR